MLRQVNSGYIRLGHVKTGCFMLVQVISGYVLFQLRSC
jgi:hypothetical protein